LTQTCTDFSRILEQSIALFASTPPRSEPQPNKRLQANAADIVDCQEDRETRETKIVIQGRTLDGREAETIVKVGLSGILYVITVYLV